MKKLIYSALLSTLIMGLAACGEKSGNDVKQAAQNAVNAMGKGPVNMASYASACTSATLPNIGIIKFPGTKTIFEISMLNFKKTQGYYTDGNCTKEGIVVEETGKVDILGDSKAVPGALDEDFHFNTTTVTVKNDAIAKAFNFAHICNYNNDEWAVNVELDVSSRATGATCPGQPSPRVAQEVVLVNDRSLLLGADALQPNRPGKINQERVYLRQ